MKDRKIGIVTVLYNSEKVLQDFFISLNRQTYKDFILYIIDNASSDCSIEFAHRLAKEMDFQSYFICNNQNCGVAKGNNQGIKKALLDGCDYILLSNNDIVLNENCIELLLEKSKSDDIKVVVPKIYFYNSEYLWYAGGRFIDYKGAVAHWGYMERDASEYNEAKFVEYAPTCVALIHSSVFSEIGYFDEKYFVYYDDTDFMRRLKLSKINVLYYPQAFLWHKESMSTGGMKSDFSIYYMSRNQIFYILKYFNRTKLVLFSLYSICHFFIKKIFGLSFKQKKILFKGYKDGWMLYRNNC